MRKCLSAPAAALLLTLTALPASAQYVGEALPPFEVMTIVRSAGMDPLHRPVWKGGYYVLRAINPYGEEVRVIVHGRNGRIVSIRPVDSQDIDVARPAPRGAYPVPDYDADGQFYDERRAAPPGPPIISAPRTRPQTRQAAIDPSTLPLPRPKPAEAKALPADSQPGETKPANAKPAEKSTTESASSESPPKAEGEIRVIEIYKKPELPEPEGEAEKSEDTPPVSPLEDATPKPNL